MSYDQRSDVSPLRENEKVSVFISSEYFNGYVNAVVVEEGKRSSKVVLGSNGKLDVRKFRNSAIFSLSAEDRRGILQGFEDGDSIVYNSNMLGGFFYERGIFRGSNTTHLAIQESKQSEIEIFPLEKIIVEEYDPIRIEKLNETMLQLITYSYKDQDVEGWIKNDSSVSGRVVGVNNSDIIIELFDGTERVVDVSQLYTDINCLTFFGTSRTAVKFLEKGDELIYIDRNNNSMDVEIIGFRYYRVLVKTETGELLDVPIGRLIRN